MQQRSRRLWNVVGIIAQIWADIGFVHAWISGDAIVLGTYLVSSALAMQTYAALAVGAGAFLISWNWDVFRRWRKRRHANSPEAKFRGLSGIISTELHLIDQDMQFPFSLGRSQGDKFVQRQRLRLELSRLGINTPHPANGSDEEWYTFVANLLPLSEQGLVEDARLLWDSLRQQLGNR